MTDLEKALADIREDIEAAQEFSPDQIEGLRRIEAQLMKLVGLGEPEIRDDFQSRVWPWLLACFGDQIASDKMERNHRFLEEALELVQSIGCTKGEAHQLVDYVFSRPVGEPNQEVGGVMVTLAALCLANGLNMHQAGEMELGRIWGKVDAIREKQANKPKHSPLPQVWEGDSKVNVDLLEAIAEQIEAVTHLDRGNQQFLSECILDTIRECHFIIHRSEAAAKAKPLVKPLQWEKDLDGDWFTSCGYFQIIKNEDQTFKLWSGEASFGSYSSPDAAKEAAWEAHWPQVLSMLNLEGAGG